MNTRDYFLKKGAHKDRKTFINSFYHVIRCIRLPRRDVEIEKREREGEGEEKSEKVRERSEGAREREE